MTKEEFTEVMHQFFDPIYQMIGGTLAFIIIGLAVMLVVKPFIRKLRS